VDFHDPANVLAMLNLKFPMEKHNNMFFTLWYGIFNRASHQLTYSSGGHPPAILMHGESLQEMQLMRLRTPGMVIGGMGDSSYLNETVQLGKVNRLYVYSDGVFEIGSFTLQALVDLIAASSKAGDEDLKLILRQSELAVGNSSFPDDYSLMRLDLRGN
jgi:phosphoserine phosphatase RsbU/P